MTGALDMDRVRFIANDPNSPPEARRHARMILARESGDPSVDMALEASATPITADKPFDWEQPLADFDARNQARTRERQDVRVQQQLAMEKGYEGMRAARGEPMAGSLGESQVVDGVEVPVIEGPAGRPMYRLGDVKAAQAAQREAARVAGVREVNRLDEEQFGYGSDNPTMEQLGNRAQAQLQSVERANSPAAVTRRVQDLAARMGVSEKQAWDAYTKAAMTAGGGEVLSLPNVKLALDAARRELSGMEGVVDRRAQQKADARDIIMRRAQSQNNPLEYLGRDDLNDWQRMVMARRMVGSSGFTPIEMQARQNEGLQRLGERYLQGGGGKPLDPAQAEALARAGRTQDADMAAAVAEEARRLVARNADNRGWTNLLTRMFGGGVEGFDNTLYTLAEEDADVRALMARYPHLTEAQAREHVAAASTQTTRPAAPASAPARAPGA